MPTLPLPHPRLALVAAIAGLATLASGAALAQAVTNAAVNVRAGPDRIFPAVTWVLSGTPAQVHGCVDSWRWCDVTVGRDRGWVYARYLSVAKDGRTATILQGGPKSGFAPVAFAVREYWDAHYQDRRWFGQSMHYQTRWERRRPQQEWSAPAKRAAAAAS